MALTDADHAAAVEAARAAGVKYDRAVTFVRSLDLGSLPRDQSGALDGAALQSAVGALASEVPEFLIAGAATVRPGDARRAPVFGAASPLAPTGATVYPDGPDAEVAELLQLMRAAVGLAPDGGVR